MLSPPCHCFKILSTSPSSLFLNHISIFPEYFFDFDFFFVHRQLPSMTFFPFNCSVAPVRFNQFSVQLCKPPLVLILLSLTSCNFSRLLTYYLLPLPPASLRWLQSPLHLPISALLLTFQYFTPRPFSYGLTNAVTPPRSWSSFTPLQQTPLNRFKGHGFDLEITVLPW